jgi:hypothetical protein
MSNIKEKTQKEKDLDVQQEKDRKYWRPYLDPDYIDEGCVEVRLVYSDGTINEYTISEGVAEMIQETMEKE